MVMKARVWVALAAWLALGLAGCGYTTKSLLPEHIQRVHVPPVTNNIDLSEEISDKSPFRIYRPGLEVDLTNAIINRYIFDGRLKVTDAERADAVLEARLVDYRRDALRYSDGDEIQEYRLNVTIQATFREKSGKVLWNETIIGDSSYFLSGGRSISEDEAAAKAVEDAARRVVEKTIEYW